MVPWTPSSWPTTRQSTLAVSEVCSELLIAWSSECVLFNAHCHGGVTAGDSGLLLCAGGQAYTFKMAFSNNTSLDNEPGQA